VNIDSTIGEKLPCVASASFFEGKEFRVKLQRFFKVGHSDPEIGTVRQGNHVDLDDLKLKTDAACLEEGVR